MQDSAMDDIPVSIDSKSTRFVPSLRACIRRQGLAYSTEKTYLYWVTYYIRFHKMRHPKDMGPAEVDEFLTWLSLERKVAPATQRSALNALVFLYQRYLDIPLGQLQFSYAKISTRIPLVLSHNEAMSIIAGMSSKPQLIARLMYGCGLRLMESCRLRVQDIDFSMQQIVVRESKGNKQRTTVLPESLLDQLGLQLKTVKKLHDYDLSRGHGGVYLPYALARKYKNAEKEFKWQYLFPASLVSSDPRDGTVRRHHIDESWIQKCVRKSVRNLQINKKASCHTFCHPFAGAGL